MESSLPEICKHFLSNGTAFSTIRREAQSVRGKYPPIHPLIRNPGYVPNAYDYFDYEDNLRAFFHHRPYAARAALFSGGLIWRLAKEVLGDELDNYSLLGPSSEARYHGESISIDGVKYWYDELSDEELDLICGRCVIRTQQSEFLASKLESI
jgi:hypothetical protein